MEKCAASDVRDNHLYAAVCCGVSRMFGFRRALSMRSIINRIAIAKTCRKEPPGRAEICELRSDFVLRRFSPDGALCLDLPGRPVR